MPILVIGGILVFFGLLAIYSVSIYESFNLSLKLVHSGVLSDPTNYYYFFKQLKNLILGVVVAFVVYKIPLESIQKHKGKILLFFFLFQLLVFTPLGAELNGAKGWLRLGPLGGTVQPSEFFKQAFVIFMAGWLLKKKDMLANFQGFFAFLFLTGIIYLVFLKIPDLGTVLVLGLTSLVMYWYSGGRFRYAAGLIVIGLTLGLTVGMQFSYIKKRLDYFMNPEVDVSGRGVGWQTQQALIAVGGGGFLGNGYGKGLQKFGYIPEAQSDFIFAAFSEEIGLLGGSVLLTLYFLLAYYFLKRLPTVKNEYYRNLGAGTVALIIMQMFVNVGVNIKLLPLTGLTLPFVSFGGTAMMVNLIQLVLLYKIIENK